MQHVPDSNAIGKFVMTDPPSPPRLQARLTMAARVRYINLMSLVTLELRSHAEQTALNLRRWAELLANPELAKVEGRIETDRHGRIIMSPPPAPKHGNLQLEIGHLLRTMLSNGRTITECPISTADGVKAA